MAQVSRLRSLVLLFFLYFAQGLPFGFQTELSSFLRQAGMSLTKIGLASLLALPWFFKWLWAPLVDRFGWPQFGRRKSWIVPVQVLLALVCVAAAFVPPTQHLSALMALVLLMNLFAATQDIAVDGLAVDLLAGKDLGPANTVQVVGYKFGMIMGGGVLVSASEQLGWQGMLFAIAGLILAVLMGVLLFLREPPERPETEQTRGSLYALLSSILRSLLQLSSLWLVLFILSYKIGETMVDAMLKPFLIDAGYSPAQLAKWVTTYGMVASLLGSALGGAVAYRLPILSAVALTGIVRALSMAGEYYLTVLGKPSPSAVILATTFEHFGGGALTTAMFAFMMSRVDRRVGATHYTVLACIEILGKFPGRLLSGLLATSLGYRGMFGLGTALSFAFLLLLIPLSKSSPKVARAALPPPESD